MPHIDDGLTARGGLQAQTGACLVDHIDRLVRQVTIVDVARGEYGSDLQGFLGVGHLVVLFEAAAQPL